MPSPVARRTRRRRSSESRRASWVERSESPSARTESAGPPRRPVSQDRISPSLTRRVIVPPIQQRTLSARFRSGLVPVDSTLRGICASCLALAASASMLEIKHEAAATGRTEGGDMTKLTRRDFAASAAAAATGAGLGFPMPALAQAYPARPVTVIVPWGAGGGTDATARIIAALLEKDLGQPFNVVNRTGGSGVVGHSGIATAQPDGYTI